MKLKILTDELLVAQDIKKTPRCTFFGKYQERHCHVLHEDGRDVRIMVHDDKTQPKIYRLTLPKHDSRSSSSFFFFFFFLLLPSSFFLLPSPNAYSLFVDYACLYPVLFSTLSPFLPSEGIFPVYSIDFKRRITSSSFWFSFYMTIPVNCSQYTQANKYTRTAFFFRFVDK